VVSLPAARGITNGLRHRTEAVLFLITGLGLEGLKNGSVEC
jgi:hypothetical protein